MASLLYVGWPAEKWVKERESKRSYKTDTTGIGSSFGRERPFDSHPHKEGTLPASEKKAITAETAVSTSPPSSPELPEQQEFHHHLRTLAQSAVRTVLELVMREELDASIKAALESGWVQVLETRIPKPAGYLARPRHE